MIASGVAVQTKSLGILVVILNVAIDRINQVPDIGERSATQSFVSDFPEPALHHVSQELFELPLAQC